MPESHYIYPGYGRPLQPREGGSSAKIKERVALVARVLAKGGILPWVFGHCSARLQGGDVVYMMSHVHWEGKLIQEVTADDIHMVSMNGDTLDCDSIDVSPSNVPGSNSTYLLRWILPALPGTGPPRGGSWPSPPPEVR